MNINRFMKAHMDNMTRSNKYEVSIHGPGGLRSRGMRVTAVSMPALTVNTTSHKPLSTAPAYQHIKDIDYGASINMTFMLDHTFEDRQLMERWQAEMYDEVWNLTYPEKYEGTVKITQLGVDSIPVYEVELHRAWPTVIGEITFNSSEPEIQTFDTTFAYRTWTSSYENAPAGLLGGLFNKFSRKLKSKAKTKLNSKLFGSI